MIILTSASSSLNDPSLKSGSVLKRFWTFLYLKEENQCKIEYLLLLNIIIIKHILELNIIEIIFMLVSNIIVLNYLFITKRMYM